MTDDGIMMKGAAGMAATEGHPDGVVPVPGCARGYAPGFAPLARTASRLFDWSGAQGQTMTYTATAGYIPVVDDEGNPLASLFAVSYVAASAAGDGIARPGVERPVTFLFNGGPGSSSVWINTGGFGPVKAPSTAPEPIGTPPYSIEDNPCTLLKYSDLVFIDAPGTGWSPLLPDVPGSRVWGIDQDADVFCRAVTAWLSQTGRWNSPKYLFGESYATTRSVVVARMLQNRCVDVSGVVLLSTLLDWMNDLPGSDAGMVALIPSYAATARYHAARRDGADAAEASAQACDAAYLTQVEEFAIGTYAPALFAGDRLPKQKERAVAGELARICGIDADVFVRSHLRIGMERFRTLLLGGEGKKIGRFDSRYTGDDDYVIGDASADPATDDAATAGVNSAEYAGFRMAMREIGFDVPSRQYLPLNNMAVEPAWDWSHTEPAVEGRVVCANAAVDLSAAMRRNPGLKLAVLGGAFDLACPYLGARNDIARLYLSERLRANVSYGLYGTGHMAYADAAALEAMDADMCAFYTKGSF